MNKEDSTVKFGVSPAFVFSLYGQQFSVSDFCKALPQIKKLGFDAFQPEIFLKERLAEWLGGGAKVVAREAEHTGLRPSQFVAHFMWEYFSSPEMITPQAGLEELKKTVQCAAMFEGCSTVTVPSMAFKVDWSRHSRMDSAWFSDLQKRLEENIRAYLEVAADAGLRLAFEITPFSVVGGIRRYLELCNRIGSPNLGLNLDVGHAWACRELVPLLPFELEGRIFGTHLGDNLSTDNVKMTPGKGTIEWKPLLKNLAAAGYTGSLDIEIACGPKEVFIEYQGGLAYLKALVGE